MQYPGLQLQTPGSSPYKDHFNIRNGSIFIITVWSLLVLSTFAVYLGAGIWQRINLIERLDNMDTLHFIAEAGVNLALAELGKIDETPGYDTLNESWSNNPDKFKEVQFGRGNFIVSYEFIENGAQNTRYGLMDEESKININKSDEHVISRLIQILTGMDENSAMGLSYCIIDWGDKDSFYQHPTMGAEDSDYRDLENPYEAKDAEFEIIDELLLVKGITQEIFDKLKDYITIYTNGEININTASKIALLSLGLNTTLVDKIASFRSGEDMLNGTPDDRIFTSADTIIAAMEPLYPLNLAEKAQIEKFASAGTFITNSNNFMIKSTAKLDKKNIKTHITAVANRGRFIKYWREN